jgi:serine protease
MRNSLATVVAAVGLFAAAGAPQDVIRAQSSGRAALIDTLGADAAVRARIAEARLAGRHGRPDIVAGQVVVKLADSMDFDALATLAADHGVERVRPARHGDFFILSIDPAGDPVAVARDLASEPGVVYAEPVGRVWPLFRPNDPLFQYQWNLEQLEFEQVWSINEGGPNGVVVAVIDSGVAYTTTGSSYLQAPDLAGTTFLPGYDFIWDDDTPIDLSGHGTHVTGTVAQSTNNAVGAAGIAFHARVIPIKAISDEVDDFFGSPNVGTNAIIAQAVRFAAENGAKVINMSLGGYVPSTPLRDALQFAVERGAVVVIAAGNDGDAGNLVNYPAAYAKDMEGVIAVGASTLGRTRAVYSNANDYVEVVAPGGDLSKDDNRDGFEDGIVQQTIDFDHFLLTGRFTAFKEEWIEGTSMASPHVAGLATLLIDQGITDPRAVEAAIKRFANDLGPAGRDNEYGYGLIDPRATLRGLGLAR